MKLSEKILAQLEHNREAYHSGEALAVQYGVSRNAVWKAVRQLQEQGHNITARQNRGYRLCPQSDLLSVVSLVQYLGDLPIQPEVYASIGSTNTSLRQRAELGAEEGLLLVAEEQTAGRGRFGRSFYSPSEGGIYMSLLLRPNLSAPDALCITTAAAVAVCRALSAVCGIDASIKWVNDVFFEGKKLCGIATEAAFDLETGGLQYAVLGIGLNLYPAPQGVPLDLQDIIGTVFPEKPQDGTVRVRLIAEIVRQFWLEYPRLAERAYFESYKARCFVLGKQVDVVRAGQREAAEVLGLQEDFSLQVRFADGREEALSSGEVSLRL